MCDFLFLKKNACDFGLFGQPSDIFRQMQIFSDCTKAVVVIVLVKYDSKAYSFSILKRQTKIHLKKRNVVKSEFSHVYC